MTEREELERAVAEAEGIRLGEALHRLGVHYANEVGENEAEACFARALAIYDEMPAGNELGRAAVLLAYSEVTDEDRSALIARAIASYERVLAADDPRLARAWLSYAKECKAMCRIREARDAIERARACSEAEAFERELVPDRQRLGTDAPAGWVGLVAPADRREVLAIARDARLAGRHEEARRIVDGLPRRPRIAASNAGALVPVGRFSQYVSGFSFSRDGERLALATAEGVHVMRTYDLAVEVFVETHADLAIDLASHGSRLLARMDGLLLVFSAEDGSFVEQRGYNYGGWLALGPDDDLFATANSRAIRIGKVSEPGVMRAIVPGAGNEVGVAFVDGGATVVAANYDHALQRWRVADGVALPDLPPTRTHSFDVTPGGEVVASDGTAVAVIGDGTVRRIETGHVESITAVAVSPDGELVATAALDRELRVLGLADGVLLHVRDLHETMGVLRFSGDGRLLAASETDLGYGTFRLFGVS